MRGRGPAEPDMGQETPIGQVTKRHKNGGLHE